MREEYNVQVLGKAFILRPDIPKGGTLRPPRTGESGDQLSEPLRSFAEQAGLVMRRSTMSPYTMYALEATEYAQQQGQFDAFHLATYKAYWEDLKDIGDIAVIQELALGCGLDWPELAGRLDSGYYRDTVLGQYQQAMNLGIRGIPAFLIGNQLFTGAQPYDTFKLAIARAREEPYPRS